MGAMESRQSAIYVSSDTPGESGVLRHKNAQSDLIDGPEPGLCTILEALRRTIDAHPHNKMLGHIVQTNDCDRHSVWQTYSEVDRLSSNFANVLTSIEGYTPGCPIGLWSINRPEWIVALLAIWKLGSPCVTIYDSLGEDGIADIADETNLPILITTRDHALDGVHTIYMDEIIAMAVPTPNQTHKLPSPGDTAYIMYTSGTTGTPKGVVLSHGNVAASLGGMLHSEVVLSCDDLYMSYLPLAHSFETCMVFAVLLSGGSVGFYSGDVQRLSEDAKFFRPTLFAGVPRVYTRLQDRIQSTIMTQSIFKRGLVKGAACLQSATKRNKTIDRLVFDKVKAVLGGRVRLMVSGAAPLPSKTFQFLRTYFGCDVIQGYGMTENMGCACATGVTSTTLSTVGVPSPCTEIKLIDVPELGYTTQGDRVEGEVCLRGPNVFQCYFKNPAKTAEVKMTDGWIRTGDIGRIRPDLNLEIIDRRKHMFKLAQGEYVAVEQLETIFGQIGNLSQLWIHGTLIKPT